MHSHTTKGNKNALTTVEKGPCVYLKYNIKEIGMQW